MPVGLALPVGVSPTGGAALSDSDENDEKIIGIAIGADDNDNAFQQNIGLGESSIFETDEPTARAKIVNRLRQIFRRFELQKRYRLVNNTIEWKTNPDTGELVLEFQYLNLESDEPKTFSRVFTTNSAQQVNG